MMTGRVGSFVTRVVAASKHRSLRVRYLANQIDIVAKNSYDSINDGTWLWLAYSFLGYLRCQHKVMIYMNVKCDEKTSCWVYLWCVQKFYEQYPDIWISNTENDSPKMLPADAWRTVTIDIAFLIDAINITYEL